MTDRVDEIREPVENAITILERLGHSTMAKRIRYHITDLQRQVSVEKGEAASQRRLREGWEKNCDAACVERDALQAKCASMERVVEAARTQSEMSPPKIRPETVTEIVSSIIVETGNGEFADYLIDFIEHHQRTNPVTADALNAHDSALTGTEERD